MSCLQILKRIFLPFCMLLASAVLNAQNISLSLRSVPVSKAITEIQKASGYSIVVKSDGLDLSRQVSVNAENEDIRTVIGNVFAGQDVEVTVSGKNWQRTGKLMRLGHLRDAGFVFMPTISKAGQHLPSACCRRGFRLWRRLVHGRHGRK